MWVGWCPTQFLQFVLSGIPCPGMVLSEIRMGLSISINILKIISHRQVVLDSVRSTTLTITVCISIVKGREGGL